LNLTSILLVSLVINESPSGSSRDLEAKWRREYPVAVKAWDAVMGNFVAEGRFSFHWNEGSTTVIDALTVAALEERKVYIENRMRRLSTNPNENRDAPGVSCQTPEYKFGLKKDRSSGRYLLVNYEKNEEDDEANFNYWYQRYVNNATHYYGRSFLQRMLDPSFSLKSIVSLKRDGEDLVRIEYACDGKYVTEAGHVDLDPNKNWGIRSVDMIATSKKNWPPASFKDEVAYREVTDGRFFPCHMESNEHDSGHPEIYERTITDLDRITLGGATPDLFRLSAYGLPDLPLRPQKRASIFTFQNPVLWLALAATVVCFVALWLLRSRRVLTS